MQVGKETTKEGPSLLFSLFLQEGERGEERVLVGGKTNEGRTMRRCGERKGKREKRRRRTKGGKDGSVFM